MKISRYSDSQIMAILSQHLRLDSVFALIAYISLCKFKHNMPKIRLKDLN